MEESRLQEARKEYHRVVKGCDGEMVGLREVIIREQRWPKWPGMNQLEIHPDYPVPVSQTGSLVL